MHPLGVVPETAVECFDSTVVLESCFVVLMQKSCEFGAKFADLEKKQIQLNLDLQLARDHLRKTQDDAAGN